MQSIWLLCKSCARYWCIIRTTSFSYGGWWRCFLVVLVPWHPLSLFSIRQDTSRWFQLWFIRFLTSVYYFNLGFWHMAMFVFTLVSLMPNWSTVHTYTPETVALVNKTSPTYLIPNPSRHTYTQKSKLTNDRMVNLSIPMTY